ncbi:FRG domain-containing protein [Citrobacter braakii]|uniref:FRG domain-containing protein n=1 Tax=Citrobacter braakii TaxID=57706 RepID=UPI000CEE8284|nr:FRG domain-containing protein [Citrobacter braakii]PPS50423.1 hypothetical protein BWR12_13425 [Citrobacter braakii]
METITNHFNNAKDFLNNLLSWNLPHNKLIFRGHSQDEKYKLLPSILRDESRTLIDDASGFMDPTIRGSDLQLSLIQTEYRLLSDFFKLADRNGLSLPISDLMRRGLDDSFSGMGSSIELLPTWMPYELRELAGLAQHYGIPTRLLDWTYDPLISAFFAAKGAGGKEGNLSVWCFNSLVLQMPMDISNRLPISLVTPPYYGNPNLNAQKGVFTVFDLPGTPFLPLDKYPYGYGIDRRSLDEIIDSVGTPIPDCFYKFTLPCNQSDEVVKLLEGHGYGESRIFPGYGGVASEVMYQHDIERKNRKFARLKEEYLKKNMA